MKFLIAGLGNIGDAYKNTRHNIGFQIADALAEKAGVSFYPDRYAACSAYKYRGKSILLLKPTTYMNLSGKAVVYWMQKEHVDLKHLFIMTDDLALPFGTLRIRAKGTDGGHNGLASIIESLQSNQFPRLRFGIGNEFPKGMQSEYVLAPWNDEELKKLPECIERCVEAVHAFVFRGVAEAMNRYNSK